MLVLCLCVANLIRVFIYCNFLLPTGTIFAYGQTSSGKTFTMMGSKHITGVIPLAMADVFQTIKNVSLEFSSGFISN